MQFLTTTFLALLGVATALPSSANQARDFAGAKLIFYPEPNFGGKPVVQDAIPANKCQAVPEGIKVGSVKVASGALCRLTYDADTCSLHGDQFVFPDEPAKDLSGHVVSHYLCQECTGCQDPEI